MTRQEFGDLIHHYDHCRADVRIEMQHGDAASIEKAQERCLGVFFELIAVYDDLTKAAQEAGVGKEVVHVEVSS